MQIKSISIKNFRAIENQTFDFVNYNTFVGANGSGKSTVLNALNLFFGELDVKQLTERDFFKKDTSKTIEISVTFCELNEGAKIDFDHYVRAGLLTIVAEFSYDRDNKNQKTIKGERLIFRPFAKFFEAQNATERGTIYNQLSEAYTDLPTARNDSDRKQAIRDFEETLPEDQKILIQSGDQFFGATGGQNRIKKHLHWVYIPAVKDASLDGEESKASHLGKLMEMAVRGRLDYEAKKEEIEKNVISAYSDMLDSQKQHLEDLNKSLSGRLQNAFTNDVGITLTWKEADEVINIPTPEAQIELSDPNFVGKVENFGHGLQRTFLIILLQEIAQIESETTPTLILGCEEPELYQHPTQAKHLAGVLAGLANNNAQILVTTHSPYFINIEHFEGIKRFSNFAPDLKISKASFEEILTKYNRVFNKLLHSNLTAKTKLAVHILPKFNELFFMNYAVLVEGISDQACLDTIIDVQDKQLDCLRKGIGILVCDGKSHLALMKLIADAFDIPTYVIFDCDDDKTDTDEKQKHKNERQKHKNENSAIFKMCDYECDSGFPDTDVICKTFTAWKTNIEDVIEQDCGSHYKSALAKGEQATGHLKNSKKYPICISVLIQEAKSEGCEFTTLTSVIERILA